MKIEIEFKNLIADDMELTLIGTVGDADILLFLNSAGDGYKEFRINRYELSRAIEKFSL